jgi:predicted CXXCH cytochrome family protein
VKRTAFALLFGCMIVLASTSVAYANFGPHGGFGQDTDACAGCHRAHTSVSTLGWTDNSDTARPGGALLVSSASNMTMFCEACHGDGVQGAGTNVVAGKWEATNANNNSEVTASHDQATLNGGGFVDMNGLPTSSSHNVDGLLTTAGEQQLTGSGVAPSSFYMWGNVTSANTIGTISGFTCTSCHDPHGSSNYRLLKDTVNGVAVGGYTTAGTPQADVQSYEAGFPTGGFKKGAAGVQDIKNYVPNYTTPEYRLSPANDASTNSGLSAWCSACHTQYDQAESVASYNTASGSGSLLNLGTGSNSLGSATYNYTSTNSLADYHRHPVGVTMTEGAALLTQPIFDAGLPLELPYTSDSVQAGLIRPATDTVGHPWMTSTTNGLSAGAVGCLTCHVAHGTSVLMDGWAAATLIGGNPAQDSTKKGVAPTNTSDLLRYKDRGVCERCHNK